MPAPEGLVDAVRASAARLGVNPSDVLTAMSYETGGRLDPNLWGGKNNNYLGLIQFGPEERAKYGVKPGQNAADQVNAAENFLRDRGVKPGMGLLDIYSTINAGRPGLYNRSDAANGGAPGSVADKVAGMAGHRMRANALLGIEPGTAGLGASSVPQVASAAPAGPAPMSLAPGAAAMAPGGASAPAPDDGSAALLQGLQGVSAAVQQPAEPMPGFQLDPIHYVRPAGLAKARALAQAMSNRQLG